MYFVWFHDNLTFRGMDSIFELFLPALKSWEITCSSSKSYKQLKTQY